LREYELTTLKMIRKSTTMQRLVARGRLEGPEEQEAAYYG
jgi:hypothetical protein